MSFSFGAEAWAFNVLEAFSEMSIHLEKTFAGPGAIPTPKASAVVQTWQSIANSWIGFGKIATRRHALFRSKNGEFP